MNWRDWFRPYVELKRGIVNLKSGTVFRGVVFKQAGPYLVLRSVEILEDRGKPVAVNPAKGAVMDGEVLVMRSDIDFIQVVS